MIEPFRPFPINMFRKVDSCIISPKENWIESLLKGAGRGKTSPSSLDFNTHFESASIPNQLWDAHLRNMETLYDATVQELYNADLVVLTAVTSILKKVRVKNYLTVQS